jgi:DNA mismatch repair ATPase MutS
LKGGTATKYIPAKGTSPFKKNYMISSYMASLKEVDSKISELKRKDDSLSFARLGSFIFFILGIIFSISTNNIWLYFVTPALLIVFIRVVIMHLADQNRLQREKARKEILENEIACLQLTSNQYYNGNDFSETDHNYIADMDVFGNKSLFHYINRCATGVGNKALADWLGRENSRESILRMQDAVKELAKKKLWCQELRVDVYQRRITNFSKEHLPSIEKTLSAPKNIPLFTSISFILLALIIAGMIFTSAGSVLIIFPIIYNAILNNKFSVFTKNIRAQLEGREKTLNDYQKILLNFEQQKYQSSYLQELQKNLTLEGHNATQAIASLQNLSQKLDYSLNMIVGAILNLFFVWDILMCRKISLWFDQHADKTRDWFNVIGKLEALISLANLQNNHPEWVFPVFTTDNQFVFKGEQLGHPLIPAGERVCNDFTLNSPYLMNIITGSNMAGKSTFLRTIGVNIILAKAGAPVCAKRITLSHFRIMTYLTITDSLAENTSTFYREIKRLKKLLDSARADNNVLLLLDEMLRGTNSADKARGSMAITRELINYKVPSVIATHNLELAAMHADFPKSISNYYFDIVIDDNNQMRFDYKLKPGICNTFNASILLKEIGIDI